MQTTVKYFRIDKREICFLRFIIEAYDGLAVLTTIDPQSGIVKLNIAPGCEADVEMILAEINRSIMIERLDENQKYIH